MSEQGWLAPEVNRREKPTNLQVEKAKHYPFGAEVNIKDIGMGKVITQPQYSKFRGNYVFWVELFNGIKELVEMTPRGIYKAADIDGTESGDPDADRYQPPKPLTDSNVEQSYMATPDVTVFTGEAPSEADQVRHQPIPDAQKPNKPISLFPEGKLSTADSSKAQIDRFIDLGISMLGEHADNVDRVMDILLSSRGHELEDSEWQLVEDELQSFVENLDPENTEEAEVEQIMEDRAKEDALLKPAQEVLHQLAFVDAKFGQWTLHSIPDAGFYYMTSQGIRSKVYPTVEELTGALERIRSRQVTGSRREAQITFEVVEESERPEGQEAVIRIPRTLTKATDVRDLNNYFKQMLKQYDYKFKEQLGKDVEFRDTNQFFPDVHEDYVDFIVLYDKMVKDTKEKKPGKIEKEESVDVKSRITDEQFSRFQALPDHAKSFFIGAIGTFVDEAEIEKLLASAEKYSNITSTSTPKWVDQKEAELWSLAIDKSANKSYKDIVATYKSIKQALQQDIDLYELRPIASVCDAAYFSNDQDLMEIHAYLVDKQVTASVEEDHIAIPWFARNAALETLSNSFYDYQYLTASRMPIEADMKKFREWITTQHPEVVETFSKVKPIEEANNWGDLANGLPASMLLVLLEEYVDKHATLMATASVKKEDDGWHVYSESGRHLGGPYESKNQADKRLRQCEYYKHKGKYQLASEQLMTEGAKYSGFRPMPDTEERRLEMRYDPSHPSAKNMKKLTGRLVELGVPMSEVTDTVLAFPLSNMNDLFNLIEALQDLGEKHGIKDYEMLAQWKS